MPKIIEIIDDNEGISSTDIDDCEGVNCNDGQCVDGVNTYLCDCDTGFTGDHCQISE